ncbi:Drebrin-like isoform X1 [Aix galericulata]|nr:Drebrin-like isoform X1 [Aix galericulata]
MGAPGLDRHRLALLAAKEDVGNPRAATNWAVFAYEKHHDLKLLDSGAGGADELAGKFCASSVMYGLCRLRDPATGAPRIVLISWVGEKTPESQRQACAGHLPAIRAFFRVSRGRRGAGGGPDLGGLPPPLLPPPSPGQPRPLLAALSAFLALLTQAPPFPVPSLGRRPGAVAGLPAPAGSCPAPQQRGRCPGPPGGTSPRPDPSGNGAGIPRGALGAAAGPSRGEQGGGQRRPAPRQPPRVLGADAVPVWRQEASVVLSARRAEEVTQEGLSRALAQLAPAAAPAPRRAPPADTEELVGTNYRKTNPALEIRRTQRDSFWAQAEREEEQRKEEERRRMLEERRRWERERMEEERREAAEREQRFREKERLIEEHRKEQARLEAEERRKEKARWEQQQREHEEAMRERSRRSESIEKAAEAAVLVSQRPQNPRDFFRQRERAGSTSGAPLPAGPEPGGRSCGTSAA